MKLVAVVQVSLEPEWFRLEPNERVRFRGQLARILNSHPELNCRWFDSEPWTGKIAEFFVCEFFSLQDYWKFWNELREHPVFAENYARIARVSLGVERSLLEDKAIHSRWFDADAWTGEFSDFVTCEFEDLDAYNELWSEMRRHPFLATPYARIGHVLMGMELETEGLATLAGEPQETEQSASLERPPETSKPQKSPAPEQRASVHVAAGPRCWSSFGS